jgi:glycosyltransferase involved in cell wall biosynthesis
MIQVQCVLVLYKQRWEEAKSLRSLLEICKQEQSIASRIALFVQDNSPEVNAPVAVDTSLQLEYYRAPGNPGLAEAYNRALAIARDRNVHWLLLLDQDTTLDRRFLLQLFAAVEGSASPQVCAFVPELVKDDLVLSPQTVGRVFYHRLPIGFSGLQQTSRGLQLRILPECGGNDGDRRISRRILARLPGPHRLSTASGRRWPRLRLGLPAEAQPISAEYRSGSFH